MKRFGFGTGCVLVFVGVMLHVPMFLMSADDHWMMAGMGMGTAMPIGMLLILVGLVVAMWGLLPDRSRRLQSASYAKMRFAALDEAPLSRQHWALVAALTVGLVIDTMKPATLGFVVPGMADEYGISTAKVAVFPFAAIVGTVIGSIVWGYLADVFGRRATILISGLMYVSTSICGFMPSFTWNLVMCLLMGAAAGGMLPTVYSLMSESIPAKSRGWVVVLQSGLGAVLGYLVASGCASLLVDAFSWRFMWLLNAPTGALLLALSHWFPESPRFLLASGRTEDAERVMARYGIAAVPVTADTAPAADPEEAPSASFLRRASALVGRTYRTQTSAIMLYALGWGLVNWGFITFLPTYLKAAGHGGDASKLLFLSALLGVPNTAIAAWLYAKWSSKRSMVLYSCIAVVGLAAFVVLRPDRSGSAGQLVIIMTLLLACTGGMIAMLSPYSTEVYPTSLRATGSGFAAAASKAGGLLSPLLVAWAPGAGLLAVIGAVPVAVSALVLTRTGAETVGRPLVEEAPPVPLTLDYRRPVSVDVAELEARQKSA